MSQTTHGPKGALQPTTYITGGAVVRGCGVKRGADATTVVAATANSVNLGVATDNQAVTGRTVPVAHRPGEVVEVRAGAAFALDAFLTTDANGKFATATTGQNVTAIARQAATALDQLVPAELVGPRVTAP